MKTIVRTKLLDPTHIELRSYELGVPLKVIHCISDNYKKCTHVGEDYMIYTEIMQKKGVVINTQKSKYYPYDYYRMLKFLWKPKGKIESTQLAGKKIIQINSNTVRLE